MRQGCVIGVVGPSGVGKDSVMAGIVKAAPQVCIVKRVITRAPEAGGEDYQATDERAFAQRAASGGFCLHWHAHGLSYGIPTAARDRAFDGQSLLINLSRKSLAQADLVFPNFIVLQLTATPETLAARLAGRGRETATEIGGRLARSGAGIPPQLRVIKVANDGPLENTVAMVLTALEPITGALTGPATRIADCK